MTKFFLFMLLIFLAYIYLTIGSNSRAEINHTVAMIPDHIGTVMQNISEKADEIGK